MIDDYLPIRLDLPDDADVSRIAEHVKIDDDAVVGKLIRVWAWAQRNSVDGKIAAPVRVVDRIALCRGFADAMRLVGWLDVSDDEKNEVRIPKWEKWNSKAAKKRAYDRDRQRDRRGTCRTNVAKTLRQSNDREEQEEEQEEEELEEQKEEQEDEERFASAKRRASADAPQSYKDEVLSVFAHYRRYHPQAFPRPNSRMREWRNVVARLKDGYTASDLCTAIDGNHRSPFHCGENEGGKRYNSLELITRTADKVAVFIEMARDAGVATSAKTSLTARAAAAFVHEHQGADGGTR